MSKKQPVKPVEEEDEEASFDEVDSQDSDSETEQMKAATPSVKPQPSPMPQNQPPSSSDEQESESDSDGPDSNVTPPASKAVDTKKATTSKPAVTKRPSEDTVASKDAKKAKRTADPESSEKKSNLFQRLWSEDDEIVILKGMIDFSAKNKSDVQSNFNDFYNVIKSSLHIDFTRAQIKDKIRRLKNKYEKNKSREKENFDNAHEQSAYELSKEIWGNESGEVVGSLKANGRKSANKKGNAAGDSCDVKNLVAVSGAKKVNPISGGASLEERMLINGRKIYEVGREVEGEKEWQKLNLEEMELYLKQLEVRVAQTKLVLNVLKSGDR